MTASCGAYQVRAGSHNEKLTWTTTALFTISDAKHEIEVEWDAVIAEKTDGNLKLKLEVLRGNRVGLDNETLRIDQVRLGALGGIDNGTRGITFFEQFESFH